MITLKFKDFIVLHELGSALHPGIQAVLRAKKVQVKARYWLTRIGERLQKEAQRFAELRLELVKEFGEEVMEEYQDGDATKERGTDRWRVKPEVAAEFLAKQQELLEMEIQIEFKPLKLADLGEFEGPTAEDIIPCLAFIVEE